MVVGAEVVVFQLVEVEDEICLLVEVLKLAEALLMKTAAVAAEAVGALKLAGIGLVVVVLNLVAVALGTVVAAAAVV